MGCCWSLPCRRRLLRSPNEHAPANHQQKETEFNQPQPCRCKSPVFHAPHLILVEGKATFSRGHIIRSWYCCQYFVCLRLRCSRSDFRMREARAGTGPCRERSSRSFTERSSRSVPRRNCSESRVLSHSVVDDCRFDDCRAVLHLLFLDYGTRNLSLQPSVYHYRGDRAFHLRTLRASNSHGAIRAPRRKPRIERS
jgi:hypothetical protein